MKWNFKKSKIYLQELLSEEVIKKAALQKTRTAMVSMRKID
jgi:hypothetical protein